MSFNPNILAGIALDGGVISAVYAEAAKLKKDFPKDSCALVLSIILRKAGLEDLPVRLATAAAGEGEAPGILDELAALGWVKIDASKTAVPRCGDIFACTDANGNGKPDHVGVVIAPHPYGLFWARDNKTDKGRGKYLRNVGAKRAGYSYTPVAFWMRPPAAKVPKGEAAKS